MTQITYTPTTTAAQFHSSDARYRLLIGAIGTGKTSACVMELQRRAFQQQPDARGYRKTRWAVIRATFAELKSTTIRTFQAWYPPEVFTIVYDSPIRGHLRCPLPDGTFVDAEFLFIPLDRAEEIGKLLSLELTGAYINEASEIPEEVFQTVRTRIPRYPALRDAPITWHGVILDSNPPSNKHWIHILFEQKRPKGFEIYHYPPPIIVVAKDPDFPDDYAKWTYAPNPDAADYAQHQPSGFNYWLELLAGNEDDINYIKRFLLGEYTDSYSGKPVWPQFRYGIHVNNGPITPQRHIPLVIGQDWGLFPAAVFLQLVGGTLNVLDEIAPQDVSLLEFLDLYLIPKIREKYAGYKIIVSGDPAGIGRSAIDKRTPFQVMKEYGISAAPAFTNSFIPRRDAVAFFLKRQDGVRIDPRNVKLIDAVSGAYHYEDNKDLPGDREASPKKNMASHIADAWQYGCLWYRYAKMANLDSSQDAFATLRSARMRHDTQQAQQRPFHYV